MNYYAVYCLLFFVATISADCSSFDTGSYSCDINHPGHGVHGATLIFDTTTFTFESEEDTEDCLVSGAYSINTSTDSITFSIVPASVTDDLACIVDDTTPVTFVLFTDCDFNSACNSFSCESDNPNGVTTLECSIDENSNSNDNSSSSILYSSAVFLLCFVALLC